MKLLAIDTSTERATVALLAHGEIHKEEQGSLRQHAQFLLTMIERLMAKAAISFNELDGVIFGRGPGSFTGLRIACSVAKGLAFAHDLPVYPVSGLSAIAYDARRNEGEGNATVLAMIDARMNQVYWGAFTAASYETEEFVMTATDIQLPISDSVILAGVGIEEYSTQFPQGLQEQIIKKYDISPSAQAMIELVQKGAVQSVSAAEALPVYIRNQVTHVAKGESNG